MLYTSLVGTVLDAYTTHISFY